MAPSSRDPISPARADTFRDQAVVITGASSGIGEDVAFGFARQGARVAFLARRKSMLDIFAGRIDAAGGRALAIACDVTTHADVDPRSSEATRATVASTSW